MATSPALGSYTASTTLAKTSPSPTLNYQEAEGGTPANDSAESSKTRPNTSTHLAMVPRTHFSLLWLIMSTITTALANPTPPRSASSLNRAPSSLELINYRPRTSHPSSPSSSPSSSPGPPAPPSPPPTSLRRSPTTRSELNTLPIHQRLVQSIASAISSSMPSIRRLPTFAPSHPISPTAPFRPVRADPSDPQYTHESSANRRARRQEARAVGIKQWERAYPPAAPTAATAQTALTARALETHDLVAQTHGSWMPRGQRSAPLRQQSQPQQQQHSSLRPPPQQQRASSAPTPRSKNVSWHPESYAPPPPPPSPSSLALGPRQMTFRQMRQVRKQQRDARTMRREAEIASPTPGGWFLVGPWVDHIV